MAGGDFDAGAAIRSIFEAGVAGGCTAPSAHNSQPWRFGRDDDAMWLGWDRVRELPHGDPERRYLWTGLGAAAEGFALGVAGTGNFAKVDFTLNLELARVARLIVDRVAPDPDDVELARALPHRQTTRWRYWRRPVPVSALAHLEGVAKRHGGHLAFVESRPRVRACARLIAAGAARNFADRTVFEEFCELLRWDPADPAYGRDGLTLQTLAAGPLAAWAMRAGLRPMAMRVLVATGLHRAAAATQSTLARQTPVLGVLAAPSHQPADLFAGGRVMLRLWLAATKLGLKLHPMTAAFDHSITRGPLAQLFGLPGNASLILHFRLGYGPPAPKSPRLPTAEVVVDGG